MDNFLSGILAIIVTFILVIVSCVFYGLLLGLPVMICWNYVMPVFGLATLTYWQSAALAALMYIFFSNAKSTNSNN